LRLGGVERSEKKYSDVLKTADEAEHRFNETAHIIRSSARDLRYTSPLIEELMLKTTEHDRILSTAPDTQNSDTAAPQLVSPFFLSEVALLRGSALSELGQYEQATNVLTKGDELIDGMRDSVRAGALMAEQARFISDALRFERAWSLFQRSKYQEAAGAFLQLALADTTINRHALLQENYMRLREEGLYYDPFLNDSLAATRAPALSPSVVSKTTVDTSLFLYNDFPERARYYAGVALARAGMMRESAEALQRLTLNKGMLYSDLATYQLALIRFAEHSYEAQKLLEPISYDENVRGAYASFLLGELAYRRNIYERAQAYFLQSFANLPASDTAVRATAHLERGLSLIPLGSWNEASDELRTYLSLAKETTPGRTDVALFWLGKSYFRAGQFDSARSTFEQLFTRFPNSNLLVDVQYAYAWSLFQANDFARAEQAFERVIALDSISRYAYDALARAGDADYAIGDYRAANQLYNQAVDRPAFNDFRTTRALMMLGLSRMKLDSTRSALIEFTHLASKYPKSDIVDQALFDQALAAYAINQASEAEQTVERIATQYPKSAMAPRALYVAGEERLRRNDPRGATTYYQRVVNTYPASREAGPALVSLQDALAEQKRIPEALAVADTFVARNPQSPLSPTVLLRAAEFQIRLKQPSAAVTSAQAFLKKFPNHPELPRAELLLAEAELASGDTVAAIPQFAKVIAQYDSLGVAAQAYLDRARFERSKKMYAQAASDFQAAYADKYYSSDASPAAMFDYGQMLAEQKKNDSAIAAFTSLSNRYPLEASLPSRAAMRAADLLAASGRSEEAIDQLHRVISAHGKDVLAGAAAVRIGELYLATKTWSQAASALVNAKQQYSLSAELEARRLLVLARANVGLGKKADAIRQLHALEELRGAPADIRSAGGALLTELQPPVKQKTKKGRHK
jgi:TolA-binding protein